MELAAQIALLTFLFVIVVLATLSILYGVAYRAHAGERRILGALGGGAAAVLAGMAWRSLFMAGGYWSYVYWERPWLWRLPFLIVAGVFVEAALLVIAWRVIRRWKRAGAIVFVTIWSLWGALVWTGAIFPFDISVIPRDVIPLSADLVRSPRVTSLLIVFPLDALTACLGLWVMRRLAAPAGADAFAQKPEHE